MKVCAINDGGPGEWSDSVLVQIRKPLPAKPKINQVDLWSTMAKLL